MRIQALATDYDGTIARRGKVSDETVAALTALRESGRRIVLVTGRQVEDLKTVAPDLTLFDSVVAENGAVLYDPKTQGLTLLGEPPPSEFLAELRRRGVQFDVGHVVVATGVPQDVPALAVIRDSGAERQLIYNKGAVMILPSGVTKATGLLAALDRLGISPHNTAAIGDAENDHSFLSVCEVTAAVHNALPAIKERADLVMRRSHGRGVIDFIEKYLLNDLAGAPHVFDRYTVELGSTRTGAPVRTPIYGANDLIVGTSGSGKSTLTGVFVERLTDQGYQVCLIDPEGDHTGLDPLVMVGSNIARPTLEEIDLALERAHAGVVVNLVSMSPADKVRFSADLLSAVLALRASRGRPHWIVVDEAHHLLPAEGSPGVHVLPEDRDRVCMVTLRAGLLSPEALGQVTDLFVVGENAEAQIEEFAAARGLSLPRVKERPAWGLLEGEALTARVTDGRLTRPQRFRVAARRTEHRRHVRKYAAGDLGDQSFYFRGPEGRLNLRAYNVTAFAEMARGVDEATWMYHLARGDYARWFRDSVKDAELADAIEQIERRAQELGPQVSRDEVLKLVAARYTAGG
jgi:hydroxymethylpyrimidine pyrophosphatase-like HAD family hydrolase